MKRKSILLFSIIALVTACQEPERQKTIGAGDLVNIGKLDKMTHAIFQINDSTILLSSSGRIFLNSRKVAEDSVFVQLLLHGINTYTMPKMENSIPSDSVEYFRQRAANYNVLLYRFQELQKKTGVIDYDFVDYEKEIEL